MRDSSSSRSSCGSSSGSLRVASFHSRAGTPAGKLSPSSPSPRGRNSGVSGAKAASRRRRSSPSASTMSRSAHARSPVIAAASASSWDSR
ncbi:hypothetical protein D3C72_904610 [compost metagenome]